VLADGDPGEAVIRILENVARVAINAVSVGVDVGISNVYTGISCAEIRAPVEGSTINGILGR